LQNCCLKLDLLEALNHSLYVKTGRIQALSSSTVLGGVIEPFGGFVNQPKNVSLERISVGSASVLKGLGKTGFMTSTLEFPVSVDSNANEWVPEKGT